MRQFFLSLFILLPGLALQAQRCETFLISVKGDTINCMDRKKMKQGRWVLRVEALRGEPGYEEEGEFLDDKKEGSWRRYNLTGDLLAIENYKWGFRDGKQMYFTNLGDLLREEAWRAVNPENPYDTIEVPDPDNPLVTMEKVVKQESSELKHGTWKYYDPALGQLIKSESFSYGMRLDATGKPVAGNTPPTGNKTPSPGSKGQANAKPAAVADWEKKNAGKKSVKVRDGRTGNTP